MTPRELARQLLNSRKAQPVTLTPVPMNAEAVRRLAGVFDALPPREIVAEFEGRLNSGDRWFLKQFRISV